MSTLYIRDVPDEVTATLKHRAAQEGLSLSGFVAQQLTKIASTPSNADLIDQLGAMRRDSGPDIQEILSELSNGRR